MNKIKIITDSTSDISKDLAEKYNITIVPLTIRVQEKEYKDWYDIKPKEFYDIMRTSASLPTTSQVNPTTFKEVYEDALKNYDEIISIHISGNASGTCNSAELARTMVSEERITVVNSKNYTYGYGHIVVEAARMAESGSTKSEILERINYLLQNIKTIFVVDTLEYLKKGGRLSATKATIGTLLNLKPILTVEDGKIVAIDKERGMKKALRRIVELMKENIDTEASKTLYVGHADNLEILKEFEKEISQEFENVNFIEFEIGSVIGVYCGPGTVVVHYY